MIWRIGEGRAICERTSVESERSDVVAMVGTVKSRESECRLNSNGAPAGEASPSAPGPARRRSRAGGRFAPLVFLVAAAAGAFAPAGASQSLPQTPGAASPARPQEPRAPLPYRSEEVAYQNAAGVRLAGTLTLPEGGGPFPAVVLISGSGPQDRDSELFGHRPFLVLADFLTRRGIAALRSDDRGVGESGGVFAEATTADFADDARAAVQYLRARPDIRRDAVGVVGMSEGGLVAPIVAGTPGTVDFAVLLGAPGVRGDQVLFQQAALIARAMGAPEPQIDYNRRVQAELFEAIVAEEDAAARAGRMEAVLRAQFAAVPDAERAARGLTRAAEDEWIRSQLRTMGGPWFRFFLMYDPLPALREVRVPVLAVTGGRDLQVPPDPNLARVEAALREGGNADVTAVVLPGLNHLLQNARTGVPAEYAEIPETMSPEAMERIAGWILERVRR
jgi:fermentation-respiration switch protein FrsA (DUF1100 family)